MQFPAKVSNWFQQATQGNAAAKFFGLFMGRTTFFAICFSIAGVYGWLVLGRDLTSFAVFAGAIQSLLVVKSLGQDYHTRKTRDFREDK